MKPNDTKRYNLVQPIKSGLCKVQNLKFPIKSTSTDT